MLNANSFSTFAIMGIIALMLIATSTNDALSQTYEAKFDSMNASGWFGGDDRRPGGPRDIGVGQGVFIDTSITINSFAFHFTRRFDYPANPDGKGHEVTLTLNVRDDSGTILRTLQEVLPDTFAGGWVTWDGIELDVAPQSTVIFTTYLVGAYRTNQYFTGHSGDQFASYDGGFRYTKGDTSDAGMEQWQGWNRHSWDSAFWLKGTINAATSVYEPGSTAPEQFILQQNYPNPFNPETTIEFQTEKNGEVVLQVFDLRGSIVRTLVHANRAPGHYSVSWDGNDAAGRRVASGNYFYRLRVGEFTSVRRMILLK